MRLLVNTASTFKGGGVQVARSFIEEAVHFSEHEYHVVLGESISKLIRQKDYPANFFFYTLSYRPATRVFSFQSSAGFFKALEKRIKPDCVFTTSGPAYWRPKAPHLMGYNLAHYIYRDSSFFDTLSLYKRVYWKVKGLVIKYFVRRDADAYVVQTEDVNRRLKKWINSANVFTVTNTYNSYFEKPFVRSAKLPVKENGEYRLLLLSAWYSHKNFKIINSVCELLAAQNCYSVKFILTLPTEVYNIHFTSIAKAFIINVGPVRPEDCPSLYWECDGMFLPTLLECFSANYAEAMVMRKPILTSDLGFAHTVCKDAALYFNPVDPHDIVAKVNLLRDSKALQQELVDRGAVQLSNLLSAKERAARYLDLCYSLLQK